MGESREREPAEYLSSCRPMQLKVGRGQSQQRGMWAIGKGGNMGTTVSSLDPARSGLGRCKLKVRAGPREVSSLLPRPMS